MKTDLELQLALAKMLPEKIAHDENKIDKLVRWRTNTAYRRAWPNSLDPVLDTEWLHVCWLIEQRMNNNEADVYGLRISSIMAETETKNYQSVCDWHASWQQRARALIAVKGEK